MIRKIAFMIFTIFVLLSIKTTKAEALVTTFSLPLYDALNYYYWQSGTAVGYNRNQGYTQSLPVSVTPLYSSYAGNVTVPDDGSVWDINVVFYGSTYVSVPDGTGYTIFALQAFTRTVTTSGTFAGYSPRTATDAANNAAAQAQNAANAAAQARDAANAASSNAWQAADWLNPASGSTSAVKDSQGTVLTAARQARDLANQTLIAVNNLQNSMAPVLLKVSGYNGATCTIGTTFNVVVQAPGATEFRVKADTGSWSSWVPVSGYATATGITGTGAHTVFVEARNSAGAVTSGQMTVFKL